MEKINLRFHDLDDCIKVVELIADNIPPEFTKDDNFRFGLYSALTEIICNIINHAYPINFKAKKNDLCEVDIHYNEHSLAVTIADNGASIPVTVLNKIGTSKLNDRELLDQAAKGCFTTSGRGMGLQDLIGQVHSNTWNDIIITSGCGFLKESSSGKHELKLMDSKIYGTKITLTKTLEERNSYFDSLKEIIIRKDFSELPFGRYKTDSPYSAEAFRDEFIVPALKNYRMVTVDLSVNCGLASSFLEEVFGGLVRRYKYSPEELKSRMNIILPENPSTVHRVWRFIELADGEHD